ncbi:extracellular solute-binding protein [Pelagibacterium lacus]|uniref:Extracellular solute-binding protein n=2 Tax=Pelagibacterium lacus TaxID=2282655 RepID=A0A369W386_9HYPH|nr:extracellular solute-binding protein [Pelagibacterium lacus]
MPKAMMAPIAAASWSRVRVSPRAAITPVMKMAGIRPKRSMVIAKTTTDVRMNKAGLNGAVVEAVARGEKPYGIIIEYMALNAKAAGSPVDFVFPEEGVSSITQPVAILAGSDNIEAAKVFVDWQLSQAAQEQSVTQGYFPIFAGVQPPAGYPAVADLNILEADPVVMLAEDEANKLAFADLFGG